MANTRILTQEFTCFEPRSIAEALRLLKIHGPDARVIAGGTDLLVQMKMGKVHPRHLITLAGIPELHCLEEERGLRIGALTTFREIERSRVVREKYTALFEAAQSVSSIQIRNMGTFGGNICHASPAADSAPPLIAMGAKVKLAGEEGERIASLEEFFTGPGRTLLSPQELMVEIQVPEPVKQAGSAFLKMTRVAADLAKVSAAVVVERKGEVCHDCRIVLGAVAPTPLRSRKAEEVLRGKRFGEDLSKRAGEQAAEEIQPITDLRSTAWYRKEVSKILVRDALNLAWTRASKG